jgi:glycosyltransferase involved in cell wall biosynthesis
MKTICHYTDFYYPLLGGVQTHVDTIVQNSLDYKCTILTNKIPGSHDQLINNEKDILTYVSPMDYRNYPMQNRVVHKLFFPQRIISDIIRNYNKLKNIQMNGYDLLHVHGPAINMNFISIDERLGRCLFTRMTRFNTFDNQKVLTLHGLFSPYSKYSITKEYEERLINQFDNIICVDKVIYSYVENYLNRSRHTKNIWHIPNSIDTIKFQETPFPNKDKLQIGYIGRLEEPHGIKLLLEVIKNLPPWAEMHIVVAGSDAAVMQFKVKVSEISPIESKLNIHIRSNLKYDEVPYFYKMIDVLFNPVLFEAITRVSLEAMASGRPVIMTNIGDRDPIKDGRTGYLIDNSLKDALDALTYIFENQNRTKTIGKNARKVVESNFSNEVIVGKINRIYKSLI